MSWSVVSVSYLSTKIGLEEDKIRFSICLFLCVPLALFFRTFLSVHKVSSTVRNLSSIAFGLWITWFCCGWYVLHLLFVSLICYAAMIVIHPSKVGWAVMGLSFTCLAYVHFERVMSIPENYTIDISGRLMLLVQKVIFVAWSISDSYHIKSKATENDNGKIKNRAGLVPDLLLYFGYLFHFASLLVGPVVSFEDYVAYIDGTDVEQYSHKDSRKEPNPYWKTLESFFAAITCAVIYTISRKYLVLEMLTDPRYVHQLGLPIATVHLVLSSNIIRFRYYFAWKLGESAAALSGLGFTGFDEKGRSTWKKCESINIIEFLKDSDIVKRTKTWNVSSHRWVKSCIYKRVPQYRVEITYLIVAIWHGFYAGYFLCIVSFLIYLKSSDVLKKSLTPVIERHTGAKYYIIRFLWRLYDEFMLAYVTVPFVLLTLEKSLIVFGNMYYFGHLLALIIIIYGQFFTVTIKKDSSTATNGVKSNFAIDGKKKQ